MSKQIASLPMNETPVVGKFKAYITNSKRPIFRSYRDVNFDANGWANADEFLPHEYDLCYLKTECNKSLKGWYTGKIWDGLNVLKKHKIKFWKRFEENNRPVD